MRQGELLGLKWEDVDLTVNAIRVRCTLLRTKARVVLGEPKTKKNRRTVHLTGAVSRPVEEYLGHQLKEMERLGDLYRDQGLVVFTTEAGTPIKATNLRKRSFAPLLQKANLPRVRFHDLRHTCATLLLFRNMHPKYVQELLGHATISITLDTYSHFIPGMGSQVAEAMEDLLAKRVNVGLVSTGVRRDTRGSNYSHVSPAKQRILGVEPRGFEPSIFAVQRRPDASVPVRLPSEYAANAYILMVEVDSLVRLVPLNTNWVGVRLGSTSYSWVPRVPDS